MTSHEIIQRTLDFNHPDRVARSFDGSDMVFARCSVPGHATEWEEMGGGRWEHTDQWGNRWGRIDDTSKGEVVKGVLDTWDGFDNYEFPDYSKAEDYAVVKETRAEAPDTWLVGNVPGFAFSIARKMRKLDQYLMDIMLEPDRIHALHDRIDVVLEQMIRNYAAAGVNAIMFWEDWGTQKQTLIGPNTWRSEFFPRFEKLCDMAHELGIKVFMHSCGNIGGIVPGLLETGIDLLQFDQPDLHGLDTLAAYQRDQKITFWCPVDVQKTLQTKDEIVIRAKAREMLDTLWQGRGGFIAGYYDDNASIGLDPRWQGYACDEFVTYGRRVILT